MLWVVAHELGHALGDIGHTIEKYGVTPDGTKVQLPGAGINGFAPYSDNAQRLMTSLIGDRRNQHPKQLNKFERDRIEDFFDP